ncbi:hypothetical protein JHK85_036500 [Glycine max]|nr:hypothetical protein JHK85_036500 [Glycine max]
MRASYSSIEISGDAIGKGRRHVKVDTKRQQQAHMANTAYGPSYSSGRGRGDNSNFRGEYNNRSGVFQFFLQSIVMIEARINKPILTTYIVLPKPPMSM